MSLFSIVQGRKAEQIPVPPPGPPPGMTSPLPTSLPLPAMPPLAAPSQGAAGGGLTVAGKPIAGFEMGGLQELPSYEYAPRPTEARQPDGDPNEFPPDMPAYEYADRPESDYPGLSIPGYKTGTIQFNAPGTGETIPLDPKVFPTPSVSVPTTSADGSQLDPSTAAIIYASARKYMMQDPALSAEDAMAMARGDWEMYNLEQKNALALKGSAANGPDHFYEQQAEQTRQWEASRADAQRLADAQQAAVQQKAINDWKQAQLQANTQRAQTIAGVGQNTQNAFVNSLDYLSAANGPTVAVHWGDLMNAVVRGFGQNPDPNASDANTPNIPGYVYNNPNGG